MLEQAGFRKYKSTPDQATHHASAIEDDFHAKKVVLAGFIDMRTAFDKVWNNGLLAKRICNVIKGNMYQGTNSYLYNHKETVTVDGAAVPRNY